jgi:adenosylcobinamide-GDP ribazoletransferase
LSFPTTPKGVKPPRPSWWSRLAGAILFYTRLPLPPGWHPSFEGIAALAPLVGVAIGGLLTLGDWGLQALGVTSLLRSGLVVGLWIWITGGLHLDGAMDTADGLAVMDPQRRLEVMADSRTGAFGTMVAIAIVGLKTLALADLTTGRDLLFLMVPLWGRWGQVIAIARYPYLKAEGKGALHKAGLRLPQDLLPGPLIALIFYAPYGWLHPEQTQFMVALFLSGMTLAMIIPAWFNRQLGGHTGDTYGAVVEWIETLLLCIATVV